MARRHRFPGTVPVFGGLSPAGAVSGNVPVLQKKWIFKIYSYICKGKGSSLLMNINFETVGYYSCVYLMGCDATSLHRGLSIDFIYGSKHLGMYKI